jgi:hypothetical protein
MPRILAPRSSAYSVCTRIQAKATYDCHPGHIQRFLQAAMVPEDKRLFQVPFWAIGSKNKGTGLVEAAESS